MFRRSTLQKALTVAFQNLCNQTLFTPQAATLSSQQETPNQARVNGELLVLSYHLKQTFHISSTLQVNSQKLFSNTDFRHSCILCIYATDT